MSSPVQVAPPLKAALERLARAQAQLGQPPVPPSREPIHVVYGGAHLFQPALATKLGERALASLKSAAPDASTFARALGLTLSEHLAARVHQRVLAKLTREPVEDFRVDFEDGYGVRPAEEEDRDAVRAGEALAEGHRQGTLPPFVGIRIKALSAVGASRGLRTLELCLTALGARSGGALPSGFCVTLPKVRLTEEVEVLVTALDGLEEQLGWPRGAVKVELMAELPEALFRRDGSFPLPGWVAAAQGRCTAVHLGAYDYTSALGIAASQQGLGHPACVFARQALQQQLAGLAVRLSDGATNLFPVGPHRAQPGASLSVEQERENLEAIHRAWALSQVNIRRALESGIYQGWDLHPAQLPARYGAVYAFFLESLEPAGRRLRGFLAEAARATLSGSTFDDEASAQGLVNFFLRGVRCGALEEQELVDATGLTREALQQRSLFGGHPRTSQEAS